MKVNTQFSSVFNLKKGKDLYESFSDGEH